MFKTSHTPRKGRDLERTRSRPSTKIEVKSPYYSDNTEGEIEEEENDDDDTAIIYAHSLINGGNLNNLKNTLKNHQHSHNNHHNNNLHNNLHQNSTNDCCKQRLKIGKNLLRDKYKAEAYKKEFKEKLQRVFKEIYTYYYNSGNNKSTVNMEKEIRSLSSQINEKLLNCKPDYLHLFVKLLNENVSAYIKSFKDSITEKPINKKLKEKYHDLKKSIHIDINKDINDLIKHKETKFKCINEILNFCKDNKNEIVSIINDLNKIYGILMKSSPLLNQIFKIPFMELETERDCNLSMENIHKEEFFNVIINDDFIKSLIIEVKNKDIQSFIDLRPIVINIEEEITNANKDMKKLKDLIDEIDKQEKEKEEVKEEDLSYLNDAKSLHQFLINTSK
jgi:hypothetical protein